MYIIISKINNTVNNEIKIKATFIFFFQIQLEIISHIATNMRNSSCEGTAYFFLKLVAALLSKGCIAIVLQVFRLILVFQMPAWKIESNRIYQIMDLSAPLLKLPAIIMMVQWKTFWRWKQRCPYADFRNITVTF